MLTRRTDAALLLALAVALFASAAACGSARAPSSTATTDCTSCHGFPPTTGLHAVHYPADTGTGIPHAQLACLQCHENVTSVNQPGHIVNADGSPVIAPAQVRFDDPAALARTTQQGAARGGAPAFDTTAKTCSNVYCHGAGLNGVTADVVQSPAWTAQHGAVGCGNCHGIPPADHPTGLTQLDCHKCHGDAIDANGVLNPQTHVDGKIELAAGVTSSCSACHGDHSVSTLPGDPRSAPPTDTEGNASSPAVGAHQNHVVAGVLGVKVACGECHLVPADVLAPGHLDNQVTVKFGPLASKGGLSPKYDPATQTCSNVYCHGNFPTSKTTMPPPAPTWNGGTAAVACGSCHDLPPPPPTHVLVDVPTQGCGTSTNPAITCHPAPYSPATVDPTLHIDGKICPPSCTP